MLNPLLNALILFMLLVPPALPAAEHSHHSGASDLLLDNGERWATDEPLRAAMERLHADVSNATRGQVTHEMLAARIGEEIGFMVRNCRLPAAADAELHKLLVMLGDARHLLEEPGTADAGLEMARNALQLYGEYFLHAGWPTPE